MSRPRQQLHAIPATGKQIGILKACQKNVAAVPASVTSFQLFKLYLIISLNSVIIIVLSIILINSFYSLNFVQADVEALFSGSNDKKPPERIDELDGFIRKHQDQTTKLEQVLRLVENEQALLVFL